MELLTGKTVKKRKPLQVIYEKKIVCPQCSSDNTKIYCGRKFKSLRVRYRKCKKCSYTFVTTQDI